MSQTTVNQYFAARKRSFSVQPSKKRKVDSSDIEINARSNTTAKSRQESKTKTTLSKRACRFRKNKEPCQQSKAKQQIIMQGNEKSSIVFEEASNKTKTQPTTPTKFVDCNLYHKSPLGKLEVNDVINDQAKSILHSRGSTILKASLKEKSITSPAKASQVLLSMSPQKETVNYSLDIVGSPRGAGGSKLPSSQKIQKGVDKELMKRREALRKKYSNLLKNEPAENTKNEDNVSSELKQSSSDNVQSKETVVNKNDEKYKMRRKYQHLLSNKTKSDTNLKDLSPTKDKSTVRSPQKAHEKYRHLTEKTSGTKFQLPQKYKMLLDVFRSVDSILFLLQQRSEICTFDRLQKSVQSMSGRAFTTNHLAAMNTVYPNGFVFRQEKGLYTSDGKSNTYQLTIEANFRDLQPSTVSLKNNSTVLISRRLKFENALIEKTKLHHQKFLKKLNIKLPDSEIHRWHPHFKLEQVPDIELSTLPSAPVTKSFTSAADVLNRNPTNLATKVETALQKASNSTPNQERVPEVSATLTKPPSSNTINTKSAPVSKNSKLKGVSLDLLERIRLKEQKRLELAMTRNPQQEVRLSRIERLPEISRILKSYFTTEKKAAITVEDCVQKLTESYGSDIQASKLEEHLHLLAELVPKWMQIVPVRKCLYVKLAKNYDINNVINTLTDYKKKEQNS